MFKHTLETDPTQIFGTQFVVTVVQKQAKYRLKDEVNTTGKEVIFTAPGPVKLKPGCTYSVDFALAVVSDKYEYHRVPRAPREDKQCEVGQSFLRVRNCRRWR